MTGVIAVPLDEERNRIELKLADRVRAAYAACERSVVVAREPPERRRELATALVAAVDEFIDYVMRDILPKDER